MGKRIKDLSRAETDGYLAVDNATNGTGKMLTSVIFNNFASKFDPTRTQSNQYKAQESVIYEGVLYKFKAPHYGAWTGTDVERVDVKGATYLYIVTNPEYKYAVLDSSEKILFGVKSDGSFEWAKGVPSVIQREIVNLINAISEDLSEKVDKELGKSLINEVFASVQGTIENPEYIKIFVDSEFKLLSAWKPNGQQVFFSKPIFKNGVDWSSFNLSDLGKALAENKVMIGLGDWSYSSSLEIPQPKFGLINITGTNTMPYQKTEDMPVKFEFWDLNGNYFKKSAIINAQGNSSLRFPKRNVALDLLNEDGSSFKLKIGNWVTQDSFHLKAYYTDITRIKPIVGYSLYEKIVNTRNSRGNKTWKKALWTNENYLGIGGGVNADNALRTQLGTGALCHPMGFPCVLFLNGSFYGIFCWQLKKHRDNYMMKKSDVNAIHLDGNLLGQAFFRYGTIDWTGFEIRNPKDLICMDGSDYDGDDPHELIDSTSPVYNSSNKKHRNSAQVKQAIIDLSQAYTRISALANVADKKVEIERVFDVDNLIDYQIFNDFIYNVDAFEKNWQWTTWDGVKWFVNPYDLDGMYGPAFTGDYVREPSDSYAGVQTGKPNWYVTQYYSSELSARYAELREKGILSSNAIIGMIEEQINAVGLDYYEKEFERWPDCPCNNDIQVNSEYWEVVVDENGNPILDKPGVSDYSSSETYGVGVECLYGLTSTGKYTMKCISPSTGNEPILHFAFRDSLQRLINYSILNQQLKDTLYGYQGG